MRNILNFDKWTLNEAVNSDSVYNEVKKVLGNDLGEIHIVPDFETFKRQNEPVQQSILFGTSSGNSFTLNYAEDKLFSSDFWYPKSDRPALTIYSEGSSLEEVLNKVRDAANKNMKEAGEEVHASNPKPKKEINKEADKIESEYDYQDPETIFEDLKKYIKLVINGTQPSLVITGSPGVGKTHAVLTELSKAGLKKNVDFYHAKGKATAAGMYQTLWEQNGKIIIFDDMDSIFGDDNAINILKGALESSDEREISWITGRPLKDSTGKDISQRFDFTGRIIFISNLAQKNIDPAIKSRSFVVEVALSPKDMVSYIEEKLAGIMPGERLSLKRAALDIIKKSSEENKNVQVNIRTLIKALKIAKNVEDPIIVNRMVIQQCSYK